MSHTVIAARDFSIDGISFIPGDEVDLLALGKTSLEFRSLVHARFLSYGTAGRSFAEVMKQHEEKKKAEEVEQEEEVAEADEAVADEGPAEISEPIKEDNKRKRR